MDRSFSIDLPNMADFAIMRNFKGLKSKIYTAVRRNLEEILEVKTFLKMSIGFICRELRFCSFLECVHFSTTGTDKEKQIKLFV